MYNFYNLRNFSLRFTLVILFNLVVLVGCVNAQQMFTFQQTMGNYTSISSGVTVAEATGNTTATNLYNKYYSINLPFVYRYIGVDYSAIYVSSNGFITLGDPPASTSQINPISFQNTTSAIAVFAGSAHGIYNIAGKTSRIKTDVVGVAPNRHFVIEWQNFSPGTGVAGADVYAMSYQIRLEETTNNVHFVYGGGSHLVGAQNYVGQVQVGIRGPGHIYYNNRKSLSGVAFSNSIAGDANNSTQWVEINQSNYTAVPVSGLTYSWLPPACITPTNVVVSNVTATTADVSWSVLSNPSDGFEYYVDTFGTGLPPLASSWVTGTSATNSAHLTNLPSFTNHYIWVRSLCGTVRSDWSLAGTFKTLCGVYSSVNENFEYYAGVGQLPNCWGRIAASTGDFQSITSEFYNSNKELRQKAANPSESTVVFLPQLSNVNAGTHWLRLKTRSEAGNAKMDVGYVTDVNDLSTFVNVKSLTFSNLHYNSASEYMVKFPTNTPNNARIAIRNEGVLPCVFFYDDVFWEPIPSCSQVVGLQLTNVSNHSATVEWDLPLTPPANGYDIYMSTSDVQPNLATQPLVSAYTSLSYTFNNLQPMTNYYVWIRSNCGAGVVGDWIWQPLDFKTACLAPDVISTVGATICKGGVATVSAVVSNGGNVVWYDAPVGGNVVGYGNSFTTPPLTTGTTYYAAASSGSGDVRGGKEMISNTAESSSNNASSLMFDAYVPFKIKSLTVYPVAYVPGTIGAITIEIRNLAGVLLMKKKVVVIGGSVASPIANVVDLDLDIPVGTDYRIRAFERSSTLSGLLFDTSGGNNVYSFPYVLGAHGAIKGSANYTTPLVDRYYFFYDWVTNSGCDSSRQPVVVNVDTNCLAVKEVASSGSVKVYPNPFVDKVNLSNSDEVLLVEVVDVSGRMVKRLLLKNGSVDLSHLTSGVYFINITMKNGSKAAVKIVKR